jgi:predicted enzyme related to lactoylglutathione lyase
MPAITDHTPGSFCWFELATTDQEAAKQFYGSLFGWQAKDTPMGPTETYTEFQIDGKDVGAAYTMREPERKQGIPPHWLVYVRTDNADETAGKVAAAGGTVVMPPFDVMDIGRMSVVQDPTGAVFAVWQPKQHSGTGLAGENGTAVWADLVTSDPAKAGAFYSALLGWQMVEGKSMAPAKPGQYVHIVNGTEMIGGIPPAQSLPPGVPAHWMIYFAVPDCAAALKKTAELGGRTLVAPMTIEGAGTFAVVADPQGAAFAVIEPTP